MLLGLISTSREEVDEDEPPTLQKLSLIGYATEKMLNTLVNCPNLKEIELSSRFVEGLALRQGEWQLTKLTKLDLTSSYNMDN